MKKICIHETDNTNKGSEADNHARLQANGNSRQASWHWSVMTKKLCNHLHMIINVGQQAVLRGITKQYKLKCA
ncbi:hypothetical protein [Lysinibacillus capsici]|uniref:hypothetical protein n=1 Tax=Lysinibacillus capsici TaxID=2115968 RepID=UPI002480E19E|nr:hypothetical protein [Lysinibacillus capsici]